MAKKSGGGSGQKYNTSVNEKCADIYTAAKSLAGPHDYSAGYPAEAGTKHINQGGAKGNRKKGSD